MDFKKILPRIFVICVVAAFLKWCIITLTSHWIPDYSVFYVAGKLATTNPSLIYDDTAMTVIQSWFVEPRLGFRPWAYPPSALLPLIPFATLPFWWSLAVWVGTTLTAFLYASKRIGGTWGAVVLVALSNPVFFAVRSGQMTLLIGALVIMGIVLLPKREFLAGVLIGIAAALKPQLLVLAPLAFVAARRLEALSGALAGGLALMLASLALGPFLWLEWIQSLPRFMDTVTALNLWKVGVTPSAIMWNLGLGGPPQIIVNILFVGVASVIVWKVFRSSDDPTLRLVALIGGGLLCAPYAINYELALLAPAAAMWMLKRETSLWLMVASGLLLFADGPVTPAVAMAFLFLALKDSFVLPFRYRVEA